MSAASHSDGSTRAQVIALLRRGPKTVDEIADAVGVTDNAVRLHLTALERDGLARAAGVRREGLVGKPATLYDIVPEGEARLSRAYEPVLTTLLVTLAGRLGARELTDVLRDVGRQLGASTASQRSTLEERVEAASDLLRTLGGDTQVERAPGELVIRGFACPLASSVAQCPPLCAAVEELVGEMTGAEVEERCDREGRPRCSFAVSLSPKARRRS